jgi:hypothetical protein
MLIGVPKTAAVEGVRCEVPRLRHISLSVLLPAEFKGLYARPRNTPMKARRQERRRTQNQPGQASKAEKESE